MIRFHSQMVHQLQTISIGTGDNVTLDKEIYENTDEQGTYARLEIGSNRGDNTVWLQSGIVGIFLTEDEFRNLYPLIKGYAEMIGVE